MIRRNKYGSSDIWSDVNRRFCTMLIQKHLKTPYIFSESTACLKFRQSLSEQALYCLIWILSIGTMCQSENIYSDKHKKHCTPWVFMLSRVVYTSTCLYLSIRLVFNVYRPTVFSGSRACSATLFAVSRWKRACSRAVNYSKECKAKGFLKIQLGVFIVFVDALLKNISLHFLDESKKNQNLLCI